ncbi:U11/U12 small nuclear ribonucleoprotein 48 kDa protein [Homalodisca vitripennis]|nr:U11/U12 small nuclear ribonucleoprotein 48 kDa protein [Homalodisca vitripennis]
MMERNVNERNSYVKSLQQLILCSKKELECFMQELNWIEELTLSKDSEKDLITCPVNSTHRVPSSNLHKHADACRLRQQGYGDDSVFLPPPCGSSLGTVVIDKDLQAKIILDAAARDKTLKIGVDVCKREVPQTSDRYTSDLTSDERRVLYDYVVERTAGKVPQPQDFSLPSVSEGGKTEPMTREQLFAAERDAKRRRVRYRSVKVHTKSKNYSEFHPAHHTFYRADPPEGYRLCEDASSGDHVL